MQMSSTIMDLLRPATIETLATDIREAIEDAEFSATIELNEVYGRLDAQYGYLVGGHLPALPVEKQTG